MPPFDTVHNWIGLHVQLMAIRKNTIVETNTYPHPYGMMDEEQHGIVYMHACIVLRKQHPTTQQTV